MTASSVLRRRQGTMQRARRSGSNIRSSPGLAQCSTLERRGLASEEKENSVGSIRSGMKMESTHGILSENEASTAIPIESFLFRGTTGEAFLESAIFVLLSGWRLM
jgi:hypothetical protein